MSTEPKAREVTYAMVGGGFDSWIGRAHRLAIRLVSHALTAPAEAHETTDAPAPRLVAGVFSASGEERSAAFAREQLRDESIRTYASVEAMLAAGEAARLTFVVVLSPNAAHAEQVQQLLAAGVPVVCDKPLAETSADARAILARSMPSSPLLSLVPAADAAPAATRGIPVALTHTYTGYAMVKQARHLVASGRLGKIRKVLVEYVQGWLLPGSAGGRKGTVTSLLDVGTHAEQMVRYITGLRLESVCADACSFVADARRAPDDYSVLLRFAGGARGVLVAAQSGTGDVNPFRIRVYGSDGSLDWVQESPDRLQLRLRDAPPMELRDNAIYTAPELALCPAALQCARLPPGHPEGYLEAFSNIYSAFLREVGVWRAGDAPHARPHADYPDAADGLESLLFVEAVERSAASNAWVDVWPRVE